MKVDDIVICINNYQKVTLIDYNPPTSGELSNVLTINKHYKILDTSDNSKYKKVAQQSWILIECDDESQQHFSKERFISLREYNLNKLKI
jgi:hypothetical protein